MRSLLVGAVCSFSLVVASCGQGASTKDGKGIFGQTSSDVAASCEGGGIATNDEVAVSDDIQVRSGPSSASSLVVNEKASAILKETHYQSVDQTERLKELCRQKDWSKVQVVEPEELSFVVGWVPVKSLRAIERDNAGRRTYTEGDFAWDSETEGYKPQLVANVNKIVRENERCESVDTGTLSRSGDRGSKAKPVFFITCNNAAGPFNVWFEPGDAAAGKRFTAVRNIDQGSAVLACEQGARGVANNPHTVSFSTFLDVAFVPYPNGNSRLVSSFTAKNAFGVEGKFRIECFFEGAKLSEVNVGQAGD